MSLILDALRKLDREKSSRREGTLNIAAEILRPDPPLASKKIPFYAVAILLTAVATATITYAVIRRTAPPANRKFVAPTFQPPPATPSREPVRSVRDVISRPPANQQPPVEKEVPVESKIPVEIKMPVAVKESPLEIKTPPPLPSEAKRDSGIISKEAPSVPEEIRKSISEPTKKPAPSPSSLRLSGIVWSEDPTKRLAVINGVVTMEGYSFEGVKVVEIHPDRVVLLLNDQPFELSLNR
ncbi:MAG: general secretion pathway protein GspB [Thermodesulfobacteriota bacterium]